MAGFGGAVKLTGESEYKKALASINQSLKEVDSELKLVTSQYDKNDKSEEALSAQTEVLTKKYEAQADKVSKMKDNYASLAEQAEKNKAKHEALKNELESETDKLKKIEEESGKSSDAYKKQADLVNTLSGDYKKSEQAIEKNEEALSKARIELNNSETALNKTANEINKLGKESEETAKDSKDLGKEVKSSGDSADKAKGGYSALKATLADLASNAIQACIKGFKDLTKEAGNAYKEFDTGRDNIIKATGATGEVADSLIESYKKVSKSVVGDMGDIGSAIGEVSTRFGLTGEDLEKTTESFIKFSSVTGMDTKTAIQEVSRAMEKAGIDSSELGGLLDMLTSASQNTGVSVDRLTDAIVKYQVPMKSLGFDTSETIAIFSQFEKTGVNVEEAFAGLQKASIAWTKEGKNTRSEFLKLMGDIKKAPTTAEASQKAIEVFGKKAGPELATAIREGKLEYGDLLDTIEGSQGTLENTFQGTQDSSDQVKLAIQGVKTDLGGLVDNIMQEYAPQITSAINSIVPTIEKIANSVLPAIKKLVSWFTDNLPVIAPMLGAIAGGLTALFVAQKIQAVVTAFQAWKLATEGQTLAQTLLNAVMNANPIMLVVTLVGALVGAIIVLWNTNDDFREALTKAWENIKKTAEDVWGAISTFFTKTLPDSLKKAGEAIGKWVVDTVTYIGSLPGKLWEHFTDIIKKVGSWSSDMIKKGTDTAIEFVAKIANKIKELPGKIRTFLFNILTDIGTWGLNLFNKGKEVAGKLFSAIVNKIRDLPGEMLDIGKRLVEGIWDGINNATTWLGNKIKGFCDGIVDGFKSFLSIFSPSRVMSDQVGKFMAMGIGVGFEKEMKDVTEEMESAIPTKFDVTPEINGATYDGSTFGGYAFGDLVNALKEALTGVDVVMDDVKMGKFVTKTVTDEVYS